MRFIASRQWFRFSGVDPVDPPGGRVDEGYVPFRPALATRLSPDSNCGTQKGRQAAPFHRKRGARPLVGPDIPASIGSRGTEAGNCPNSQPAQALYGGSPVKGQEGSGDSSAANQRGH
jgi:hypothetical protein